MTVSSYTKHIWLTLNKIVRKNAKTCIHAYKLGEIANHLSTSTTLVSIHKGENNTAQLNDHKHGYTHCVKSMFSH